MEGIMSAPMTTEEFARSIFRYWIGIFSEERSTIFRGLDLALAGKITPTTFVYDWTPRGCTIADDAEDRIRAWVVSHAAPAPRQWQVGCSDSVTKASIA